MSTKSEVEYCSDHETRQPPDVIVKFRNDVRLPYIDNLEDYLVKNNLAPWEQLIEQFPGISIQRIYVTISPDIVQKLENSGFSNVPVLERPNLLKYYRIQSPAETDREALAEVVKTWDITQFTYVPLALDIADVPRATAIAQSSQIHLDSAPGSIGAEEAWATTDADGRNMKFVDLERGWYLNHQNFIDPGTSNTVFSAPDPASQPSQLNTEMGHGASVLGTVAAPDFGHYTIGIAFRSIGQVISINRTNGQENIHEAMLKAVDFLDEGDVILIEAQAIDSAQRFWPVEINTLEFNEISTVTANKRVIIEAAGNGKSSSVKDEPGNNLDSISVLDRKHLDFKDSGAIMVGSAVHTNPHSKMLRTDANRETNFGNRVDCYAWGEKIRAPGGGSSTGYDISFGSTSGASAMIAGAALIVQGLAKANQKGDNANKTFSPLRLRAILADSVYGTPSTDPIGSMPDLVKIIDNCLHLGPDLYLRDFVNDDGAPHAQPIGDSPDIIACNMSVPDYNDTFGQGSANQNLGGLSKSIEPNNGGDKYVYVRISNRGSTSAQNVQVTLYWSEASSLLTPGMWHLVGTNVLTSVPAKEMRVCQIVWPSLALPPSGNHSFICLVNTPRDPAPNIPAFPASNDFDNFIRQSKNVTCCHFKVW